MKKLLFVFGVLSLLGGCKQTHSTEYYEKHIDEAHQKAKECFKMAPEVRVEDKDCEYAHHAIVRVNFKSIKPLN